MKKALAVLATSAALVTMGALPSYGSAEKEVLPVDCGSDGSYLVVVSGNGEFTPARDTGSTHVLIPIAFSGFEFTATAPDGTVLASESDDSVELKGKGNPAARSPRHQVNCTFGSTVVLEEPEDGFPAGTTLSFSGHVTGYITPGK